MDEAFYLNFIKVDSVFLQEGRKAIKAVISRLVMPTIGRDGLERKNK